MFKKDFASSVIAGLLRKIHNYEPLDDFVHVPRNWIPPTFVCVAQDTAAYYSHLDLPYDPWWRCLRPPQDGRPNEAFYVDWTPLIFVCPDFFKKTLAPQPSRGSSGCPKTINNQFIGDENAFYKAYQTYILLYQLIRFYLRSKGLGPATVPREAFDWNVCVSYSARASIVNPTNILLYIAMVEQRCSAEPDPKFPPFGRGHRISALSVASDNNSVPSDMNA
ncbi:hypothetical protein ACLMJK_005963 [Lecanora helva]